MKKKIIGIFVCMLLITISVCTLSASADSESELRVGVFGASMMSGLRRVGGVIYNDGLDAIQDVQCTFTITGGSDDSIDITISDDVGNIENNQAYMISTKGAQGYGPVTITMTATSSNAGEATATSQGFQIGPYTISKTYLMAWR
jgi:putative cell wall-binding protein